MGLLDTFLSIIIIFIIISNNIVHSHRFIIIPRKPCCKNVVRAAFTPLVPISTLTRQPQGPLDIGLRPEEDPMEAASRLSPVVPPPIYPNDDTAQETNKAYLCSQLTCPPQLLEGPVCACNFKTGSVVTFKNKCDLKKHNCRFDTGFKVILNEICPWEFQSRRSGSNSDGVHVDYDNPKYYN